jgi:hypothetical protein
VSTSVLLTERLVYGGHAAFVVVYALPADNGAFGVYVQTWSTAPPRVKRTAMALSDGTLSGGIEAAYAARDAWLVQAQARLREADIPAAVESGDLRRLRGCIDVASGASLDAVVDAAIKASDRRSSRVAIRIEPRRNGEADDTVRSRAIRLLDFWGTYVPKTSGGAGAG